MPGVSFSECKRSMKVHAGSVEWRTSCHLLLRKLTHHLVLSGGCDLLARHTAPAYGTDQPLGPNDMKDSTYR